MKFFQCATSDELFEHVDETGLVRRMFNITLMKSEAPRIAEPLTVPMEEEMVHFYEKHRGVEEWKVSRLCGQYLSEPVIGILEADLHYTTTIDGHHRIVRLFRDGKKTYEMYRFKPGTWEKFMIEDIPDWFRMVEE